MSPPRIEEPEEETKEDKKAEAVRKKWPKQRKKEMAREEANKIEEDG